MARWIRMAASTTFAVALTGEQYRESFPNSFMSDGLSGEYLAGTVCDLCGVLILLPQGMPIGTP